MQWMLVAGFLIGYKMHKWVKQNMYSAIAKCKITLFLRQVGNKKCGVSYSYIESLSSGPSWDVIF